ncbi:GNAT family N-acetyltransferase [Halobacillus sp. Marseille-Q1614]|uniref:GNAT family N-acetyltransferase n=1 Tax=Halobacillus sp. Marseille-Q1614 TaxID=2709134 RepID=UPI00156F6DEB|nr:GNAT family protein [Halobacillus sp. Marseille-Q1614]
MLRLENFTEKDEQQLIAWISDPRLLVQWAGSSFTFPLTSEQLEIYRQKANCQIYKAVEGGLTVGHAALKNIDHINRSARVGHIFISSEERGKGLGLKMLEALLEVSFNELQLHKVSLGVFDFNEPAVHTYKKAGFQIDGCLLDHKLVDHEFWNLWEMSILESEWNVNDS